MKNLLKNRIVVGLACIIVALVICFGLTPMFNDALASTVEVVRVNTGIRQGDQITAKMVTVMEVGGYNLPTDVVCRVEDVVGRYANADLYKGDYILAGKLSETPLLKNGYLAGLDGTNRAMSITIKSFAAGLSGKLERGDIVSLVASNVGSLRETLIPAELQYVEIIATTLSDGTDSDMQEEGDSEGAGKLLAEQARVLEELYADETEVTEGTEWENATGDGGESNLDSAEKDRKNSGNTGHQDSEAGAKAAGSSGLG